MILTGVYMFSKHTLYLKIQLNHLTTSFGHAFRKYAELDCDKRVCFATRFEASVALLYNNATIRLLY